MWTEIIDLVVLGRNYWGSCRVHTIFDQRSYRKITNTLDYNVAVIYMYIWFKDIPTNGIQ